jgi:hypothetical protein
LHRPDPDSLIYLETDTTSLIFALRRPDPDSLIDLETDTTSLIFALRRPDPDSLIYLETDTTSLIFALRRPDPDSLIDLETDTTTVSVVEEFDPLTDQSQEHLAIHFDTFYFPDSDTRSGDFIRDAPDTVLPDIRLIQKPDNGYSVRPDNGYLAGYLA